MAGACRSRVRRAVGAGDGRCGGAEGPVGGPGGVGVRQLGADPPRVDRVELQLRRDRPARAAAAGRDQRFGEQGAALEQLEAMPERHGVGVRRDRVGHRQGDGNGVLRAELRGRAHRGRRAGGGIGLERRGAFRHGRDVAAARRGRRRERVAVAAARRTDGEQAHETDLDRVLHGHGSSMHSRNQKETRRPPQNWTPPYLTSTSPVAPGRLTLPPA